MYQVVNSKFSKDFLLKNGGFLEEKKNDLIFYEIFIRFFEKSLQIALLVET